MKKFLLSLAVLATASTLQAKVELPGFFSDNMVLQQNTSAAIWGTAKAGAKVTIKADWTKEKFTATAESDGTWFTRIKTPGAGGPWTITISDGEKLTLSNVLIGEVWFCSGQSNMEMPVRGFNCQPNADGTATIMAARRSTPIRMCNIANTTSLKEEKTCKTDGWMENTPEAVAGFSATAYHFGEQLEATLDIPIGLISSDWGGTPIEAWMNRATLEKSFPEFDLSFLDEGKFRGNPPLNPTSLFNGMVAPLIPFTFKGWIWYQGEANRTRPEQYERLTIAYAQMMRDLWDNQEMPYYFVQIAPYAYNEPDGTSLALLCEHQLKASQKIRHCGMATTADVGDGGCIHPAHKKAVGQRLAFLALENDYGFKGIDSKAPTYKSFTVGKDGKAVIEFNVGPTGLAPLGHELTGFEVAGEDGVFHPATGRIRRDNKVDITCPEVSEPKAVRYCYRNVHQGTLFNLFGIPVGPFSSEDF